MKTELFFVHLYNDFSGSPRVFRDAIDSQPQFSQRKFILTSQHCGFLSDSACSKITVPYFRVNNKLLVLMNYLLTQMYTFFLLSFLLLKSRINGGKPKVVVNTLLPFGASISAKLFAEELVCYIHETSISPPLLRQFLRLIVKYCANKVIYVSNYLREEVGFDDKRETVIYNPIRKDFRVLTTLPNAKRKFDERNILFVGSLKRFKGIYSFIELARKLPEINFIGALNCTEVEYDKFLLSIKIPNNMVFYIRPDNLEELYENASLLVNLSVPELWVETFGLTIVEGFAKGCPAIVPPIGGPLEVIDVNSGVAINSHDIEALEVFIKSLLSNYIYWKHLSDGALHRAKAFIYPIYIDKVCQTFSIKE